MTRLNDKKIFLTIAVIIAIFSYFSIVQRVNAVPIDPFNPDQTSSEDPIQNRLEADKTETKAEAERLSELQRADYDLCKSTDADGGTASEVPSDGPQNGGGGGGGGGEDGSGGGGSQDEQQKRADLQNAGYKINHNNDCQGMTYQQYQAANGKSCTDMAGLPQHTVDRLSEIKQEAGCNGDITLTGGTEAGHSAHGQGKNVVDVERGNACFNNYVTQHTVSTSRSTRGVYHRLDNGDVFLDEGDHWHADFSGSANKPPPATTAWLNKAWKSIKNALLPVAMAIGLAPSETINVDGTLVDLNTITSVELNNLIKKLPATALNQLFLGLSPNANNLLIVKLSFENLNFSLNKLDRQTLNQTIGNLTAETFNKIAPDLTYSTVDYTFSQLDPGPLNGTIDSFDRKTLITIFGALEPKSLAYIFSHLSGGEINNVLGKLDLGALSNTFNQLPTNLISDTIGNAGTASLNNVFKQIRGATLNQTVNNLSQGTLNGTLPTLRSTTLDHLLSQTNPAIINRALDRATWAVAKQAVNKATPDLMANLSQNVPLIKKALTESTQESPSALNKNSTLPKVSIQPLSLTALWQSLLPVAIADEGPRLLALGMYVPVVEQDGNLMKLTDSIDQTTKSIDSTTKEVRDLSTQICTYLKAIKRIQARFEQKMVEDANLMRVKSTEIEKFRQAMFGDNGVTKTGYATLDENGQQTELNDAENGQPLFVVNNQVYLAQVREEADRIVTDEINQGTNPNKNSILNGLQGEDSLSLNSGLTAEDISNLTGKGVSPASPLVIRNNPFDNIPIISSLLRPFRNTLAWLSGNTAFAVPSEPPASQTIDSDRFWESFKKMAEPKNNSYGSYLIASDQMEVKKNEAVQAARDEALQGQGFLPVRTCLEKTSDGKTCVVWGTKQPGIIVKETNANAMNSRLNTYIQAKDMGELAQGNEPNVSELINNTPAPGGGGAPGPGMVNSLQSNSIPDNNALIQSDINSQNQNGGQGQGGQDQGENGGQQNQLNLADLANRWSSLSSGGSSGGDGSEINSTTWDQLLALFNALKGLVNLIAPNIKFDFVTPRLSAINAGSAVNKATIVWLSYNAQTCYADNNWLSLQGGKNIIARAKGASLGAMDKVVINYPLKIDIQLVKSVSGADTTINPTMGKNANLTSEQAVYVLNNSDMTEDTTITLSSGGKKVSVDVVKDNKASTLTALKEAAVASFPDYLFIADPTSGKLTVTQESIFKIKCANKKGTKTSILTVGRD